MFIKLPQDNMPNRDKRKFLNRLLSNKEKGGSCSHGALAVFGCCIVAIFSEEQIINVKQCVGWKEHREATIMTHS